MAREERALGQSLGARGLGAGQDGFRVALGRRFFGALRRAARREKCGRLEWVVLGWNAPAQRFYRKLGAKPLEDWVTYRLELEA